MDTSLLWLNFALNLAGVVAFGGLLMYSRRTRKTVNEARAEVGEARSEVAELRGRVDRFADNMGLLTTQVQELGAFVRHQAADTQHRFDAMADRDQTRSIIRDEVREIRDFAMSLSRGGNITITSPPAIGTQFAGTNTIHGPAAGSIGTIGPPKQEEPHTI